VKVIDYCAAHLKYKSLNSTETLKIRTSQCSTLDPVFEYNGTAANIDIESGFLEHRLMSLKFRVLFIISMKLCTSYMELDSLFRDSYADPCPDVTFYSTQPPHQ